MNCKRCSNVVRCTVLGAEIHPGMNTGSVVINGQGARRGGDHAGGVVDIRHMCGLSIRDG